MNAHLAPQDAIPSMTYQSHRIPVLLTRSSATQTK